MPIQHLNRLVFNPPNHRHHIQQPANRRGRVGLAAVIAGLGLGLAGLAWTAPQGLAQKPTQAKVIRIGVSKFGSVLNYIYARQSLDPILAQRGVTVEWKQFVAGPQLMEALAVGSIDFTFTGEPPPIFAQAAGTPVAYVANERLGPAAVAVLVPRGLRLSSGVASTGSSRLMPA